ncbi:hypothetical protein GQ600_11482 [Phytophthora cactorum]|nr:hypothetical protein GQ600_11482 [Phytophthora cactorum]
MLWVILCKLRESDMARGSKSSKYTGISLTTRAVKLLTMFAANKVVLAIGLALSAIYQSTATTSRNLTSTNPAACMFTYSAMHSTAYLLIDSDTLRHTRGSHQRRFKVDRYDVFTHVQTFNSQFYGVIFANMLSRTASMTDESCSKTRLPPLPAPASSLDVNCQCRSNALKQITTYRCTSPGIKL